MKEKKGRISSLTVALNAHRCIPRTMGQEEQAKEVVVDHSLSTGEKGQGFDEKILLINR